MSGHLIAMIHRRFFCARTRRVSSRVTVNEAYPRFRGLAVGLAGFLAALGVPQASVKGDPQRPERATAIDARKNVAIMNAGSAERRAAAESVEAMSLPTFRVTTNGRIREWIPPQSSPGEPDSGPTAGVTAGGPAVCNEVTYVDPALFEGGTYNIQAGFAEGEIAYAVYEVDPASYPIRIASMECVFAQVSAVPTVTEWSVIIWDGPPLPAVGLQIGEFSSDDIILPHLHIPAGTNGTNIRVEVDPDDPEQIMIFNDSGTNMFTIGFRVDAHNDPPNSPCLEPPDQTSNAFPVADADSVCNGGGADGNLCDPNAECPNGVCWRLLNLCLTGPQIGQACDPNVECPNGACVPNVRLQENWLHALNCGNGCDGLHSFAELGPQCRPSGDWVIRAGYDCSIIGACCDVDANCTNGVSSITCIEQGGTFMGDGATCDGVTCPIPVGACCFGSACLEDVGQGPCEALTGGVYLGNGTVCAEGLCDLGACCFPDGTCEDLVDGLCLSRGGDFRGVGTECATYHCPQPRGACCIEGACFANQARDVCEAVGVWIGTDTTCVPDPCVNQGCPEATIVASVPPDGTVDSRQPHAPGSALPRQGIGSLQEPIVIDVDADNGEDCFRLCETSTDGLLGSNDIASVTPIGDGRYEIVLNHAITAGGVTTIQYVGDDSFVAFTAHPANVNGDSASRPNDILFLIDVLNGRAAAPHGLYSSDVDHSGKTTPTDILRLIDLLNGAAAYSSWLGSPLPENDSCP